MESPLIRLLTGLFVFLLSVGCSTSLEIPVASDGYIDLSTRNFDENRLFPMDGEWHFYHQQLLSPQEIANKQPTTEYITVPDKYWNNPRAAEQNRPLHSYGTYQVRVKLPEEHPDLGLQIFFISSACKIYINDVLWQEWGKVGITATTTEWNLMTIREQIPIVDDEFVLTIQTSNFVHCHSGITSHVYLGKADYILDKAKGLQVYKFFLFAGAFFLGLFFILTFFINQLEKSLLYFGLFIITFYYWNCSSYKVFHYFYPDFDWSLAARIEHFAIFIYVYAMMNFIQVKSLFPAKNTFTNVIIRLELFFAIIVWFIPTYWEYTLIHTIHIQLVQLYFIYYNFVSVRSAMISFKDSLLLTFVAVIVNINFVFFQFRQADVWFNQEINVFIINLIMLLISTVIIIYEQFWKLKDLSQKVAVASEAKTQFLSVISHEMRTPMNGILGMTDFLTDTKLDKQQQEYLQSIKTSGDSLVALIDDLLDSTRIQEGKLRVDEELFNLHALMTDIINALEIQAVEKKLYLNYELEENVPNYVISDPMRIKQLVDNLINNAIKFTEKGGVTVRVWAEELEETRLNVYFQVKDTGIGISQAQQAKIFDKFQQVDSSHSRRYQGVGLGLSICKQIVELMGGNMQVESQLDQGATFEFYVPLKKGTAPTTTENTTVNSSAEPSKSLHILVAEDNALNKKLILMGLKKFGYEADSVSNGREAVQTAQKKQYDLILMDLQMPEMDGIAATIAIRAFTSPHRPYIAALTANAFDEDKNRAMQAGMDEYLIKPIRLQRIETLLLKLEKEISTS